jgi:ABC-2 type transport system permease protein
MKNLRQEFYKMVYRPSMWTGPLIALGLMISYLLIVAKIDVHGDLSRSIFINGYGSIMFLSLILVGIGATFFSMEYQNKTMLTLCFRSPNRWSIYIAKFGILIAYNLYLHLWSILFTLILNFLPLGHDPLALNAVYLYHQPLWVNLLTFTGADFLQSTLVLAVVFMLASLLKSNATVISIGMVFVLMGTSLSSTLLHSLHQYFGLLKWNPLNFLNFTQFIGDIHYYQPIYGLSTIQFIVGISGYAVLFLGLGYLIFRHKRI